MAAKRAAEASYYAAAVLAAITVFVFWTLRDYGPGSAIRRFHDDLISQNFYDLQRICLEPIESRNVGILVQRLNSLDDRGATSRILSEDRTTKEVDVLVLYVLPNGGGAEPFIWVVKNDKGIWQIDPAETIRASRDIASSL